MDDHAKVVAARWEKKRAAAIEAGMRPAVFDRYMLGFMRDGGWSEETAQAICKRAKYLHERNMEQNETDY